MGPISQPEADGLIHVRKHPISNKAVTIPPIGKQLDIPLVSETGEETFILYLNRKTKLTRDKFTLGLRYRNTIHLIRLDVGGPPHLNPDRSKVECPHIHWYSEVYESRLAVPINPGIFSDFSDPVVTLGEFFRLCNVIRPPDVQRVMVLS